MLTFVLSEATLWSNNEVQRFLSFVANERIHREQFDLKLGVTGGLQAKGHTGQLRKFCRRFLFSYNKLAS